MQPQHKKVPYKFARFIFALKLGKNIHCGYLNYDRSNSETT